MHGIGRGGKIYLRRHLHLLCLCRAAAVSASRYINSKASITG